MIGRPTAAIAAGGDMPLLITELKARERERARLTQEQEQLDALTRVGRVDLGRVVGDLLRRVNEWREAARRNVAQGRQVIGKLLGGTRVQTPSEDGMCELSGRADYGKLFSGIVATAMVSPTRQGLLYSSQPVLDLEGPLAA